MSTQADITNALNNLINETPTNAPLSAGGDTAGQCTAPVIKFYQKLGWPTPPMANDSANGWGTNFPAALAAHVTHQAYQTGIAYPEGTIMMWNSPHIAIVISSDGGNTAKVFEQNADPGGSYPHIYNRTINEPGFHTPTFVLVPILQAPAPVNPCTYEDTTPRTMLTTKQPTNWWNLDNTTTDINNFVPAATLNIGTEFQVGGYAHNIHFPNYTYAMSPADYARAKAGDFSTNNGVNLLDLKESPAPEAPPVLPPPYVPPAAPIPIPRAATYNIVTTIDGYETATDAANRTNPESTVTAGTYYIFNTYKSNDNLINVSNNNVKAGSWINKADNVVPTPVPEPVAPPEPDPNALDVNPSSPNTWKTAYLPFKDSNGEQVTDDYVALQNTTVTNFDSGATTTIKQYNTVAIAGTIVKNGIVYLRPWLANAQVGKWWLIPETQPSGQPNLILHDDIYDSTTTPLTRKVTKTNSFGDYVNLFFANVELIFDKVFKRK